MKKNLAKKVTLSILAGAVLMSSSVVWAATAPSGWKDSSVGGNTYYIPVSGTEGVIADSETYNESFAGVVIEKGDVSGGKVTISGSSSFSAQLYGARTDAGSSEANTISISNGTFNNYIYGGYVGNGSVNANANDNTVNISGGTFNSNVSISGGNVGNGSDNADNNTVNISGGTFNRGVMIYGGTGGNTASNNTINISGGTFTDSYIYGGNGATVDNNTINIVGAEANLETATIYGYSGGGTRHQNNLLNIDGWSGKAKSIQNFSNINFENTEWKENSTVIEVNDNSRQSGCLEPETNGGTYVTVSDMLRGDKPFAGQKMTLINDANIANNGGKLNNAGKENEQRFKIGSYLRAKGYVDLSNNSKIDLVLTDVSANEEILALGESRAAATAFTNQGNELIETGLNALVCDNDKDTKVFAALYGNASEYATGSHVNVNGWNGIVGVGKTNDKGVTMGAFFENGEGNYRTFNEYEGDLMRGDGEATYNGGGFLYRKDNASGVYTEVSLRAGNLQNELRNVAIAGDELVGYDIDIFYYGAHVGVGKVIPRGNEGDSIDVYGKFIYTHYDDEDFTIDGGKFHLDSIESERLRLGFRINEVQNNKFNMYYGAAWEYEFGGDSNNAVVGYDIDVNAPSLGGSTVIGEIGAHYKASDKWSIDLNGRAYVGQREGFSCSVQANYAF